MALQVQAVDDASPPRTGMAQVTVDVTNVNDNVPIISDPAGEHYCASLRLLQLTNSLCMYYLYPVNTCTAIATGDS